MKNRIGVLLLVLVLICAALGIALIVIKNQAADEQRKLAQKNEELSSSLVRTNEALEQHKQVIANLYAERATRDKDTTTLTNRYVESLATLSQVSNKLVKTELALKESKQETATRDAKIVELETQNQALDRKSVVLSTEITNLTAQIEETKHKLEVSEGEKGFLDKELKRLMAEKAELERQFNDLTVLRAQVSKLKGEMATARRLEWVRQGLYATDDQKGAQRLMQGPPATRAKAPKPSYDLNVEVGSDGSVKVIPPLTNRPAVTSPPAK